MLESFYLDDGLTGTDSVKEAVYNFRNSYICYFQAPAWFTLHKWKTNEPDVLAHVARELKDQQPSQESDRREETFTKVLSLEWDADLDAFHPTVAKCLLLMKETMKRSLLLNIAHFCDMLG